MDREQLEKLQYERLMTTLKNVYEHVPLYRDRMKEQGVEPGDIRSVHDLAKLPFTTKTDLRDTYPYGMFCRPMDDIVRIHASSGTTGKQTVVGYTEHDLAVWAEVAARALYSAGCTKRSVVQVCYGYGLFTGGLGAHAGAERIGAAVIPASTGNTQRQITMLRDFGTNIICGTPSYMLYIAETMEEMGIDKSELSLVGGVFGAEPWTAGMRQEIESRLGLRSVDIYGLSEIIGPGVSFECELQCGLHINEDHFLPEIIDPQTGEVLPEGSLGELVFTCITKEGLPLIRYRTRDITRIWYDKCECGRTLARMDKVSGRSDDMLIIRGVNVFPSQVESVLLDMGKTAPHYVLIVDRQGTLDTLEVQVELTDELFSDAVRGLESLETEIHNRLLSVLGISAKVKLVEPKSIARSEGKAKRVIDRRNLK